MPSSPYLRPADPRPTRTLVTLAWLASLAACGSGTSDTSQASIDGGQKETGVSPLTEGGASQPDSGMLPTDAARPLDASIAVDAGLADTSPFDAGAPDLGVREASPPLDTGTSLAGLQVACSVPFVLDGSRVTDQVYMISHFGHLVQQYCITGTVRGSDITAYPEKMYYGSHAQSTLSLTQTSMQAGLTPTFSVKIDFVPDSSVKAGSTWGVGLTDDGNTALVAVYKYISMQQACLFAIGTGGTLEVTSASNTTKTEGGAFDLRGHLSVSDPKDLPLICDEAASTSAPCCN